MLSTRNVFKNTFCTIVEYGVALNYSSKWQFKWNIKTCIILLITKPSLPWDFFLQNFATKIVKYILHINKSCFGEHPEKVFRRNWKLPKNLIYFIIALSAFGFMLNSHFDCQIPMLYWRIIFSGFWRKCKLISTTTHGHKQTLSGFNVQNDMQRSVFVS